MSGPGYQPGRDDTRWGKVGRELAAEWALVAFAAELGASADLNGRFAGRWHVWFEAEGSDAVQWLARPLAGGSRLSAATADELAAKIEEAGQ